MKINLSIKTNLKLRTYFAIFAFLFGGVLMSCQVSVNITQDGQVPETQPTPPLDPLPPVTIESEIPVGQYQSLGNGVQVWGRVDEISNNTLLSNGVEIEGFIATDAAIGVSQ